MEFTVSCDDCQNRYIVDNNTSHNLLSVWPMYLGARDFEIPRDELPDCSAWAFSISKIYSAAARAGWIMYKQDPVANHEAMVAAIGTSQTLTHGSLSEWTWHGQLQLFDTFMSKPLDDPTSWIGAYTSIIKEKWDAIVDGFSDCPIVQPSNDYSGAYVWFGKFRWQTVGVDFLHFVSDPSLSFSFSLPR